MKIAIIGAGFGALAAAFDLSQDQIDQIEIIDAQAVAGGMASGFERQDWDWSLEEHYHHVFATDQAFKDFLQDLSLQDQLFFKKVKSSTLYQGQLFQIDSAWSLLRFSKISFLSRLRTGLVLAFLKILPNGVFLEKWRASQFLQASMGQAAWQVLWEPLFKAKFGRFSDEINMAWFWARVHPRSAQLGYVRGGFKRLADQIVQRLEQKGVHFRFKTRVNKITPDKQGFILDLRQANGSQEKRHYDLVISTLTAPVFAKLIALPELQTKKLEGLGAMTLLLRLKNKLLKDGTYWLNVNEANWPFVAVVEHDNYIDQKNYNQDSLVYLGRYLEASDPAYRSSAQELLGHYLPYLQTLNPNFKNDLKEVLLFKTPFAQPLSFVGQSRHLPQFTTSVDNLYWVCMQHVYPFDRGINHAIKSARQLAQHVRMKTSLR